MAGFMSRRFHRKTTPPCPPPATKTDIPWRESHGWGSEVKDKLKRQCEGTVPQHGVHFNIFLTGEIKAGKSSFSNSVCSMFKERITPVVHAGEASKSLTTRFRMLEVKPSPDSPPLPLRIYDTKGLEPTDSSDTDVQNILEIIDGHVPNKYEFHDNKDFNKRSEGYIRDPKKEDEVHCVVLVIAADTAMEMNPAMSRKIKHLKKSLVDREIPVLSLLTKIDLICKHVKDDISEVYHSIAVRDAVTYIAQSLVQVPQNQVLPVVNYVKHDKLLDNMDVLLFTAIDKMINAAQGYLELNQPSE